MKTIAQQDFDSLERMVAAAQPGEQLATYVSACREGVRWIAGGVPKPDVVDRLRNIGLSIGLPEVDIQSALADALERPFDPVAVNGPKQAGVPTARAADWRSHISTAARLQTMRFPPIAYVVPELIPEGLSLVAGKPKIGKSWLALDLCLAVAGDRFCLGDKKPNQGDVLFLALEDNPRRLQKRIGKLLKTFGETWPARLTLATSWRRLDKGGVEDIGEWIDSVADGRLVIVDTLAGVRPVRATQSYAEDYETLAALHRLANDRGVAILVLHHTRKMEADDPIDTVSGTLGLSGCADTILVLARSSKGTTLYVRGRDVEEAEHAVTFDRDTCRWTIMGEAAAVQRSSARQGILAELEHDDMTAGDLAVATGMSRNNVDQLLFKMARDGEVCRVKRGFYSLRPPPPIRSIR